MAPFFGWKDSLNAKGSFVRAAVARFFLCQISAKINSPTRFLLFLFTANLVCSDKRLCYELCTGHRFRIKLQKTFSFTVFLSQASYILWAVLLAAGVFLMLCKKIITFLPGMEVLTIRVTAKWSSWQWLYKSIITASSWKSDKLKGKANIKCLNEVLCHHVSAKGLRCASGVDFTILCCSDGSHFPPHLMLWWAPPDIKVQNLSLGVHLGCNLVTMKKIPVIFLLSIDLQWPFHLMGEVGLV